VAHRQQPLAQVAFQKASPAGYQYSGALKLDRITRELHFFNHLLVQHAKRALFRELSEYTNNEFKASLSGPALGFLSA